VIKKAKKQAPINNNDKTKKKVKDTEPEELNGSNRDQDWANNDSDSELSLSDANMNGNGDDDFQLGNLEIRVDRKTKQKIDEKIQKLQVSNSMQHYFYK
jgi:small-conductance mechanosensitive channel